MTQTLVASKLQLPTVASEVDRKWTSQKFGVIGPSGIGKSKLFSFDPNSFYIQTESGLNHLAVKKLPARSWEEFKDIVSLLFQSYQAGKFPYEGGTLIIDTADRWIDLAEQEVISRGRNKFKDVPINTIGDIPNGAGWSWTRELIGNSLAKLEELPCAIAFIAHLEQKEVKTATDKYHKSTISIGGKLGGDLMAWCDHLLNIESELSRDGDIKRTVRTLPTRNVEAKSREGMVPHNWHWTSNDEENWKKLRAMFE